MIFYQLGWNFINEYYFKVVDFLFIDKNLFINGNFSWMNFKFLNDI